MAYTTINKSTDYFNTKLYTGTGSSNTVTGVGFQPDFTWIKNRGDAESHCLFDAVRTNGYYLKSDANSAEIDGASAGLWSAFASDGFTVLNGNRTNDHGDTYASWNWKANGAGSANTDGTINSTVSANTTAGFSIVKYTGNGTNNATFGHGLGVAPKIMIGKCLGNTNSWQVTGNVSPLVENYYLTLDTSNALANSVNVTFDASATTIKLQGGQGTNVSGQPHIAYCFAEKTGYSKFGSYTGNGNADGAFVYTGFKPSWLMVKRTDVNDSWWIADNKRLGYNVDNNRLYADGNWAENDADRLDLLSNGFKIVASAADVNASGANYIYMAFGQPIISNSGVCATAR